MSFTPIPNPSSSVKGKNNFVIIGKDLPGGTKSKPYPKMGGSNSI